MDEFVPGSYYITRSGRKAYVACAVPDSPFTDFVDMQYPLIGYIQGTGVVHSWTRAGRSWEEGEDGPDDLIAPWTDEVQVSGWVNVYRSGVVASVIFPSRAQADVHPSAKGRRACVFITGKEGDCP